MPYATESIATTAFREAKKIWPLLAGLSVMGYASYKATSGAAAAVSIRDASWFWCIFSRNSCPTQPVATDSPPLFRLSLSVAEPATGVQAGPQALRNIQSSPRSTGWRAEPIESALGRHAAQGAAVARLLGDVGLRISAIRPRGPAL